MTIEGCMCFGLTLMTTIGAVMLIIASIAMWKMIFNGQLPQIDEEWS